MQRFLARGFSNTTRGPKIAIIGAGNVGSTTAYSLLCKNVAPQLLLADVNKELARAQALDLNDACVENDIHICDSTYKEAGESDIIVITAGAKQKQGESRLEVNIKRNTHFCAEALLISLLISPKSSLTRTTIC